MATALLLCILVVAAPAATRPTPEDFSRTKGGLQADAKQVRPLVEGDTSQYETIAACRANCVEQTLPMEWPPNFDVCNRDASCKACWKMCKQLYEQEMKFRPVCDDCSGSVGCTTACKYSFSSVAMPDPLPWAFGSTPVTTEVSDKVLHVSWELPRPIPRNKEVLPPGRPFVVYTLLFRDDNNPHWSLAIQTLDHITQVSGKHTTFPGLQFMLLASDPSGTIARDMPPYPAPLPTSDDATPPAPVSASPPAPVDHIAPAPKRPQTAEEALPLKQNRALASMSDVTVEVQVVEGRIEAVLSWRQVLRTEERLRYTVQWGRMTCNQDPAMPRCPLGEENMVDATIPAKDTEEMRLILTSLTFNSKYWLEIGFENFGENYKAFFFTPGCPTVDATFGFCVQGSSSGTSSSTSKATTTTTPTSTTATTPISATTTTLLPTMSTSTLDILSLWQHMNSALVVNGSQLPNTSILLGVGLGLGAVLILVVVLITYKRCCRRTDNELELRKVLQSCSELPLLNIYPAGSMSSLHHLQCHNAIAQNILNKSLPVNGSLQGTPAHLLTPHQHFHRAPSALQFQHMLQCEGLAPVSPMACSTPTGSVQHIAWPQQQQLAANQQQYIQQHAAATSQPSATYQQSHRSNSSKSMSMDGLNTTHSHTLTIPSLLARSASATELSPTHSQAAKSAARRFIDFGQAIDPVATEGDPMLQQAEDECHRVTSFQASIPPINHYLRTVPEDAELSGNDDESRLEWDHENLTVMTDSFQTRMETL